MRNLVHKDGKKQCNCIHCNTPLILGKNWYASSKKYCKYICNNCANKNKKGVKPISNVINEPVKAYISSGHSASIIDIDTELHIPSNKPSADSNMSTSLSDISSLINTLNELNKVDGNNYLNHMIKHHELILKVLNDLKQAF